ncbi:MAG: XdhC family protein [Gammaproteobacteria bacterium]|nr:MAG: XdhC family protein [Gammaproteobacteria bacterium]
MSVSGAPGTTDASDAIEIAAGWRRAGRQVALATVVRTWGSSPLPIGSQMVVDDAGVFAGSVSGGCVESAVIAEAREILRDGKPRLLTFGVSDERAWEVGLSCGGDIAIYVEPVT